MQMRQPGNPVQSACAVDTYRGCSHGCRYCFVQKKASLNEIKTDESPESLLAFIKGERTLETKWCDWNIPIHWGGMSDPFQPVEKKIRASYECLKVFAQTHYPFVVSTKGRLVADDEYLDLLSQCNCVVQISMVCSKYDKLEPGCPRYEERLEMLRKVSARVQRTIVRVQPYMPEVFRDVMQNIPRIAAAGAHGLVIEGMKFFKSKPGMVKGRRRRRLSAFHPGGGSLRRSRRSAIEMGLPFLLRRKPAAGDGRQHDLLRYRRPAGDFSRTNTTSA